MTNAIQNAFDRALTEAVIDQDSITLDGFKLTVTISGREMTARLKVRTEGGIREALADALRDFCAIEATLATLAVASK